MNNKYFLTSPDDVKAASNINWNVDDGDVSSAIRTAQNVYLRDIIGDRLLESVQDMVSGGTLSANPAYEELLDNYITEFLTYKACVELCVPISLKLRNIGVSQDYDSNIQAAQLQNIAELADYYETQAIDKCNRMIDFLLENRAAFPELNLTCVCGHEPNLRKRANTRLYLGY